MEKHQVSSERPNQLRSDGSPSSRARTPTPQYLDPAHTHFIRPPRLTSTAAKAASPAEE